MIRCPHCGGPLDIIAPKATRREPMEERSSPELQAQIDVLFLRAKCKILGLSVSADDHVREADAAKLIGRAKKTLRNRRAAVPLLPSIHRNGFVEYALADIAVMLNKRAPDPDA